MKILLLFMGQSQEQMPGLRKKDKFSRPQVTCQITNTIWSSRELRVPTPDRRVE